MPSSVSLPTFSSREILLYTKLNSAMAAINARFTAGIGAADLQWPVTAEGNLNMSSYNIVGGKQIWKYVNAETYGTTGTAFATAVSDAGAGGVVLVPPDITIVSDGGVNVTDRGAIIGSGPSSVLQLTAAASAANLLNASSGTYLLLANLTLDGNSVASKIGFDLQGVTGFICHNVWFKNFGGAAFKASTSCDGVYLSNCWFSGGAGNHIYVTHSNDLFLSNIHSTGAADIAVRLESSGASGYIYAMIDGLRVASHTTTALKVLGNTATAGAASTVSVQGSNVTIEGSSSSGDNVILGTSSNVLQNVMLSNFRVSAGAAGGILVNANGGSINGSIVDNPTTYCVDLDTSQYVQVNNCVLRDGTIGIDGSGCTAECTGSDNIYDGCTSEVTHGEFFWPYGKNAVRTWIEDADFSFTANAVTTLTFRTFPAYSVKPGDVLEVELVFTCSGNQNSNHNVQPKFGSQALISIDDVAGGSQAGGTARMLVRTTTAGVSMQTKQSADYPSGSTGTGACTFDTTASNDFTVVGTFSSDATSSASLKYLRLTHYSGVAL